LFSEPPYCSLVGSGALRGRACKRPSAYARLHVGAVLARWLKCTDVRDDTRMTSPAPLEPTNALSVERVLSVQHWNEHLFSFKISRPSHFRFRSGEFVMIGLKGENGKPRLRAYSPAYADELEFLSIKVPDGPLTSRLQRIVPGDEMYLGRKPTGTLVSDALLGGRRLFLIGTGTGLAPWMSIVRDPDIYTRFEQVAIVHSVRRVSDLAYREILENALADDPLVDELATKQLVYVPTVTRESFHTTGRIEALMKDGRLFTGRLSELPRFDPEHDRVMLCGSMGMIKDTAALLDALGFEEGSNAAPGKYVLERAFVG
jgi:ferredoxin/flavodoxin---NADP+ reductase